MRRPAWAGIAGIAIAIIGLATTITAEQIMAEPRGTTKIKVEIQVGKYTLGGKPKPEPPPEGIQQHHVRNAGTIAGMVAIPFAIVSWARRERVWWGIGISAIAAGAIAWVAFFVVVALVVFLGLYTFVAHPKH